MTAPTDRAGLVALMAHAMRRRPATVGEKAAAALAFIEASGLRVVPVEPTPDMLACIARGHFPEDWNAGKALQLDQFKRGVPRDESVPPVCEYEIAVGQYQRTLAASPFAPPKQEPSP